MDYDDLFVLSLRHKEGYEPYPPVVTYNLQLKKTMTEQEKLETLRQLDVIRKWIEGNGDEAIYSDMV